MVWGYVVDGWGYFKVRDREIANVWSSYGLELDGGCWRDFRVRDRGKSYGLELDNECRGDFRVRDRKIATI